MVSGKNPPGKFPLLGKKTLRKTPQSSILFGSNFFSDLSEFWCGEAEGKRLEQILLGQKQLLCNSWE